jgi:hypothetical protein
LLESLKKTLRICVGKTTAIVCYSKLNSCDIERGVAGKKKRRICSINGLRSQKRCEALNINKSDNSLNGKSGFKIATAT